MASSHPGRGRFFLPKMCIRDRTYTRVYKKYVARRRAQAITDAQFAAWSAEAKKLRTQAYKTGMHEEAFRLQLDELMENIKEK